MSDPHVTHILAELAVGKSHAAERLLPVVYDELRRLAKQRMTRESSEHTLQPTALVHEAYLRLVGNEPGEKWDNRGHFFAAAAEAMKRILIEAARRKAALKYGGDRKRIPLPEDVAVNETGSSDSLLALNNALERLKGEDEQLYKLVTLRYFGGLTIEEVASALGISERTAKRYWSYSRAWLQREMGTEN